MAKTADLSWEPKPGKQTGGHDTYLLGGRRMPIPRHNEIPENTARSILSDARDVIDGRDQAR